MIELIREYHYPRSDDHYVVKQLFGFEKSSNGMSLFFEDQMGKNQMINTADTEKTETKLYINDVLYTNKDIMWKFDKISALLTQDVNLTAIEALP